jgi:ribonucleoside-diphosphate reductase alpha chain
MRNHRYAAYDSKENYEGLSIKPQGIDAKFCPDYLLNAACKAWDDALQLGEKYGYRNAQTTVIAPTGTIGLVMDCDTTGVEPDFALVKFKKLSGGGYFKIINQSVPWALRTLGYTADQVEGIVNYAKGHGTLNGCKSISLDALRSKGFNEKDIEKIESALPVSLIHHYRMGNHLEKRFELSLPNQCFLNSFMNRSLNSKPSACISLIIEVKWLNEC